MHKRQNEHVCSARRDGYRIMPMESVFCLMNNHGCKGPDILGMLPINYCPWCGEILDNKSDHKNMKKMKIK